MEKTLLFSFNMLFVLFISTFPLHANDSDSLLERINKLRKSDPQQALHLISEAVKRIDDFDVRDKGEIYFLQGKIYDTGVVNKEKAVISFYNALRYFRESKMPLKEHHTLVFLAICFQDLTHYELAIEYYQEALSVPNIEAKYIRYAKYNLARALRFDKDYSESRILLEELSKVYEDLKNGKWLALCQSALALNYLESKEYDKSISLYNHVLILTDTLGDYQELAGKSVTSLGFIELEKQNYAKAESLLLESLKMKRQTKDQQNLLMSYLNLGKLYYRTNDLEKASHFFQLSVSLDHDKVNVIDLIEALEDLSSIAGQKADFSTALTYSNKVIALQKPLVELSERLQILHKRYKAERAKYLYEQLQLKDELISVKNTRILMAVGFSVCLLIVLLIVGVQNKSLRVRNSLIPKLRSQVQLLNFIGSKYNINLKAAEEDLKKSGRRNPD